MKTVSSNLERIRQNEAVIKKVIETEHTERLAKTMSTRRALIDAENQKQEEERRKAAEAAAKAEEEARLKAEQDAAEAAAGGGEGEEADS